MLGLGQRTVACPQCATETDRSAVWCGWCGAAMSAADRTGPAPPDARSHVRSDADAPDGPPDASTRARFLRGLVVVVALVMLAAAAVVGRPATIGESLVGRLDVGSGPSATHPPPPGLRVAWRQELGSPVEGAWSPLGAGPPVVHADRAAVGGVVVDLPTGALLADLRAAPLYGQWGPAGRAATLRGDVLEVVDVLSGEVVVRTPVDAAVLAANGPRIDPVSAVRGQRTTMFSAWGPTAEHDPHSLGTWVLVADDGSVVATGAGNPHRWGWARPRSTTHGLVTLPPAPGDEPDSGPDVAVDAHRDSSGTEQWTVIDLATGREVLRITPTGHWWQPPQVVGTHALVTESSDAPADGGAVATWDLTLHDLATGAVAWRTQLRSEEPPMLHAVTDDGRGVVARRVQRTLQVDLVDADGPHEVTAQRAVADAVWSEGPSTAGQVAATSDVVVTLDTVGDAVVATDLDGRRLWRRPVPLLPHEGWVQLDTAGDLVVLAVLPVDGGNGARLHLIDLDDGRLVHRVSPGMPRFHDLPEARVLATTDGLVAVTLGGPWQPPPPLGATDWFDVRDGRERSLEEVAAGWLRGVDVPDELRDDDGSLASAGFLRARLSGTVLAADGRVRPVVVWPATNGRLELLDGRGGPTAAALPADATERHVTDHEVVAVAGPVLVLRAGDQQGRSLAVLLDRDTGSSSVLPTTRPLGVAGPVVVAQREPGDGTTELAAHDLDHGGLRWRAPLLWDDTVVMDDEQIVLRQGAELTARRPGDGRVLWRSELGRLASGPVVLTERAVLLATSHGDVLALDRDDGTVSWRTRVGGVVTALAAAGDHALVGTHDGTVVQLDGAGDPVQRVIVGSGPVGGVVSVGPTVVATVGNQVVGLRTDGTGITRQDEVPLP